MLNGLRSIKYFCLYFKYISLLCTCTSSTFFGEYFYFYLSSFFPCYLHFYSSTKKLYLYQHCLQVNYDEDDGRAENKMPVTTINTT